MKEQVGIYKIYNLINKKFYIGSSINVKKRWREHKRDLNKNKHHSKHLQRAWNKYGKDNFRFELLEIVDDKDILLEREQYYLDITKSYKKSIGYNMSPTAGSVSGYKRSKEAIEKTAKANTKHNTIEEKLLASRISHIKSYNKKLEIDPDFQKEYNKEYYNKNKERELQRAKDWKKKNTDKTRSYLQQWRKNNSDRVKLHNSTQYKKKKLC